MQYDSTISKYMTDTIDKKIGKLQETVKINAHFENRHEIYDFRPKTRILIEVLKHEKVIYAWSITVDQFNELDIYEEFAKSVYNEKELCKQICSLKDIVDKIRLKNMRRKYGPHITLDDLSK